MTLTQRAPRLLFIDSGLGGLTVLRAVTQAVPEAQTRFIADDAGFPYGSKAENALTERLMAVIGSGVRGFDPDCIVLACNTASTIALEALRSSFAIPIVGTVPAVKPAAALTKSGLISVLATPGTVAREYTRTLIDRFGAGAQFTLVGAPHLAALAEAHASGLEVDAEAIRNEVAPCFVEHRGARTDVVVLGCTHYPLLLDALDGLSAWPVIWLDPAPAIARRIANILAQLGHVVGVGARRGQGEIQFTLGREPSPALFGLLKAHRLAILPFEAAFAA